MNLKNKIKDLTDGNNYFLLEEEEIKLIDQYEKETIKILFYSFDTVWGVFLQPNLEELSRDLPDVSAEDYLIGGILIPTEKWKIKEQPKVGIFVDEKHWYCLDAHPTCNQFKEKKYIHKFYFCSLYEKLEDLDFDDWFDKNNELFFDFNISDQIEDIKSLMNKGGISKETQTQVLDSLQVDI